MSKIINIDGVEYEQVCADSETRIVKMPYGNDVVGRVTDYGDHYMIRFASVIRKWGTTDGLGQIAYNGPTADTKLDKCPDIKVEKTAVVYQMNCVEDKWDAIISN